jgi:hypothetical protein
MSLKPKLPPAVHRVQYMHSDVMITVQTYAAYFLFKV